MARAGKTGVGGRGEGKKAAITRKAAEQYIDEYEEKEAAKEVKKKG